MVSKFIRAQMCLFKFSLIIEIVLIFVGELDVHVLRDLKPYWFLFANCLRRVFGLVNCRFLQRWIFDRLNLFRLHLPRSWVFGGKVDELGRAIAVAERDPARFSIDEVELEKRKRWTGSTRSQVFLYQYLFFQWRLS